MLRRGLLNWLGFGWATTTLLAQADEMRTHRAVDRIVLPPQRRAFLSPSGRFRLDVETEDEWRTRRAIAELRDLSSPSTPMRLWRHLLPQTLGPRQAVVTDQGEIVMIDDWINVPSPHALVVFDKDGRMRASHSIDAVIAALGVSRRTAADHGRLGIWLSAAPVASADGSQIEFAAGGRKLVLRLADGSLSATDSLP